MSIYARPSEQFEASASGFPSGLVGTIGVRVSDGEGGTVVARTTQGIIEFPEGSGIYSAVLLAPGTTGQYQVIWDTNGVVPDWGVEDLVVAGVIPTPFVPDGTARESLDRIISRVRRMIEDYGDKREFEDVEIQDVLDDRSQSVRYMPLLEKPTISPGGTTRYLNFEAPVGVWEDDWQVVNSSYAPLTPSKSDPWKGKWEFSQEPRMPVMLTGTTHDVYGAAGDLLLQWSARDSCAFDMTSEGLSLSRSQRPANRLSRAQAYHAKARTRVSQLRRTDELR